MIHPPVVDELALCPDAAGSRAGVHAVQVDAGQVGSAVRVLAALRAAPGGRERVAAVVAGQAGADDLILDVVEGAVGVLAARAGGAGEGREEWANQNQPKVTHDLQTAFAYQGSCGVTGSLTHPAKTGSPTKPGLQAHSACLWTA